MTLHVTHPKDGHGWYVEDDEDKWNIAGPYLSEDEAKEALYFMWDPS